MAEENDFLVKRLEEKKQVNDDLSQDPPATDTSVMDTLAFQESIDRRSMQRSLFSSAITIALLLFTSAIVLAGMVIAFHDKVDWHLAVLAGVFIIPPTLIMIAIIKAIYPNSSPKDSTANESLPALNLIKEIVIAFKEAASALKGK